VGSALAGQPWLDALVMLGAVGGGVCAGQEVPTGAPPAPPGFAGKARASETPDQAAASGAKSSALDQIPLLPGWNLVSLPEEPTDSDPSAVLAPIGGAYTKVSAYDVCDPADPWKLYDPNDPAASDLTVLDHRQGFWIEATSAVDLPSDGTLPAATTFELCTGWNLIGMPIGQPRHVRSVLHPIEGKYVRVFGYDASTPDQLWEGFDVQAPYWANNLDYLLPGRGYWVLVTEDVTLEIANQGPEPTVATSSPQDLDVVTQPTAVLGTVASGLLQSWALSYRLIGEPEWIEIESREYPVADGELGTFDPTLLKNGLYELRLEATDLEGRVVEETIAVSVEGQMKIGHFTLSFVDLAVPVSGLDIEVVRTYDSRDRRQGDFGAGWTLDVRQGSYTNNRPPGDGWRLETGFLPWDTVIETRSHLTVVRLSDREVYRFALRLADGAVTGGGCFATARFDFVDGPLPGATLEILGNDSVFFANGSNEVVDADTLELYEPEDVRLTTRDGRIFELDLALGVTRLEDLNGNHLTITPAGITHSSGKGIEFEHDAEGRIERIVDPRGNDLLYGYDEAGDLHTVTNQAGHVSRFEYEDDHRMVDIFDPWGVHAVRTEYDADGRLVSVTDALGHRIELRHDLEAKKEIVTNRLGLVRIHEYDGRGNVVKEWDERNELTTRTFDAKNRLLTETDPLGHTTTNVYDGNGDLVEESDQLGQTTSYTYDSRGNPTTITDPRGKEITISWDSAGNIIASSDPLGNEAFLIYDFHGNLVSETDALGHETTYEYDGSGNELRRADELGRETTFTYDANGNRTSKTETRTRSDGEIETLTTTYEVDPLGRVTSVRFPDGSTEGTTYDFLGAVLTKTDRLGRTTTFAYDAAGRHTESAYPDGTTEVREYDAEGRLLAFTDRAGRITTFSYDPVGNLVGTVYPDGTSTSSIYDAAGRLVATTDERGATITIVLDAAGREVEVVDELGHSSSFTYDAAGNQTSITDQVGSTTCFEYDDAGRLVTTLHPDGTTTSTEYDELGRRVSEVDQAGRRTELGYDAVGRLVQVTDALEGVTRFTYDELGNRTSQTDTNGHTTRFTYDVMGRLISRELPGGATESFVYDPAGNPVAKTDFGGETTTYTYDANNRLTSRGYPDGSGVSFTYTPMGRRATVTESRGVTTYSYDERARLVSVASPEGQILRYGWDPAGNRTQVTVDLGDQGSHSTHYTYDALGRMTTVTDPRAGVYTYGYDAAGRQISLSYPNGVETTWTYDGMGRPLSLRSESPDGALIQDYAYTWSPTGSRQSAVEEDGTIRSWEYDELDRLTREQVNTGDGSSTYELTFAYDAVGNRVRQTRTVGGVSETTTYTYDERDRLLTAQILDGATTSYSWDANGNLLSAVGTGGSTDYSWNAAGRLVSVERPGEDALTNSYDADGTWLAEETPSGNRSQWLVDSSTGLSEVVGRRDSSGDLTELYPRGTGDAGVGEVLASLPAGGEEVTYHSGELRSVRALADDQGRLLEAFEYEAFGALLGAEEPEVFSFAGEQHQGDLTYLRARWLDRDTGRFLSVDPHPGIAEIPATLHRYAYALNNPVRYTDRSGEIPEFLTKVLLGTAVHTFIGNHFVSIDPENRRSNKAIKTVLELVGGRPCELGEQSRYKNCFVRPDLVDSATREVYEIKTVESENQGRLELIAYLVIMNATDPRVPGRPAWHAGTPQSYTPPPVIVVTVPYLGASFTVFVNPPISGVITYSSRDLRREVARALNAAVAAGIVLAALVGLMVAIGGRVPALAY
jgi:RHS repeat-associated protein